MDSVQRRYKDHAFHCIAHALGHPFDPLQETYRNYFSTRVGDPRFENNPHWDRGRTMDDCIVYHVNDQGRAALAKHIKDMGCPYRHYEVKTDDKALGYDPGTSTRKVAAINHAKAKYRAYLNCDGCHFDYGTFLKAVISVRLVKKGKQ